MKLRALGLALAVATPAAIGLSPGAPLDGPRSAAASVAMLVSLEDLVDTSSYVVLGTAADQKSAWEDLPTGRRIITYTKITVESAITGSPGAEVWVRTLGGVVDKIGQSVSGEAQLRPGQRSLLFLRDAGGFVSVTAMAQGHYPVVEAAPAAVPPDPPGGEARRPVLRLASSPDVGGLVPRRGPTISAHERLVGLSLDEAILAVKRAHRAPK